MRSKVSNAKLKISLLLIKVKMGLSDYIGLKDEVGEETERDATVVLIKTNWPKLEATAC